MIIGKPARRGVVADVYYVEPTALNHHRQWATGFPHTIRLVLRRQLCGFFAAAMTLKHRPRHLRHLRRHRYGAGRLPAQRPVRSSGSRAQIAHRRTHCDIERVAMLGEAKRLQFLGTLHPVEEQHFAGPPCPPMRQEFVASFGQSQA